MEEKIEGIKEFYDKLQGRLEPSIYAFTTSDIENSLKVGYTGKAVEVRLDEWRKEYNDVDKKYAKDAKADYNTYFKDYSVHNYLEAKGKERLKEEENPEGLHYSREFFKDTEPQDVDDAVTDIIDVYQKNKPNDKDYKYYSVETNKEITGHYDRTDQTWKLREPLQSDVIEKFKTAVYKNKQTNLLMYAVMRFGKSFTAMMCADAMEDAKLFLVVTGKADVRDEWQKTVEVPANFAKYKYVKSDELDNGCNIVKEYLAEGYKVVVFQTLQYLQAERKDEKNNPKKIFDLNFDMVIVDETHFAARAPVYGMVLQGSNTKQEYKGLKGISAYDKEEVTTEEAEKTIKKLKTKVTLHLSGTPYRILMGNEFSLDSIICHCQFSDIVKAQEDWDEENKEKLLNNELHPWDNPYYGFPQMLRFAFQPSKKAKELIESYKKEGNLYAFSELLKPKSTTNDKEGLHREFVHKEEVLELFQAIDGSKKDENIFAFLEDDELNKCEMCRHIVCVLPYCASCDALETLIKDSNNEFDNLKDYEIINISGVEKHPAVKTIKNKIEKFEKDHKKTLTLTVNRMLTGSTVPQWDTMIYLKDTSSPEVYDQAIFRLQNQYVVEIDGMGTKVNRKPQTLLVDFDPYRVFSLQEQKARLENRFEHESGREKTVTRMENQLGISPLFTLDGNKFRQVKAEDITNYIRQYSADRGVMEETLDIPVDFTLMGDEEIMHTISHQQEIGSSGGLKVDAYEDGDEDIDIPEEKEDSGKEKENTAVEEEQNTNNTDKAEENDKKKKFENKFRTYYSRILFYAFLAEDEVKSLEDVINSLTDKEKYHEHIKENIDLADHLGIETEFLKILRSKIEKYYVLPGLENKIGNMAELARDTKGNALERVNTATEKFSRLSSSEVATPQKTCVEMVNYLDEEGLKTVCEKHGKILDIAGKTGEFAIALYEKMVNGLGRKPEEVKNIIYTIPTSPVAYEFTKKVYKTLGLNTNCIAKDFTSYDLIREPEKERTFPNGLKIEMKNEDNQEDEKMTFDYIIGNPPYQEELKDTSDNPVYNDFMDAAFSLANKVELITPARFLFNAGKTPKVWNEKMLANPHFKVLFYEKDSNKIFPNATYTGGTAISYYDKNEDFGAIGVFYQYDELKSIREKMERYTNENNIVKIMFQQNRFNLGVLYADYPDYRQKISSDGNEKRIVSSALKKLDVFKKEKNNENCVRIWGILDYTRQLRWIERKYIEDNGNLDKWKVLVSTSNGASGTFSDYAARIIAPPMMCEPDIGYTQTFLGIGSFDSKMEAEHCLNYIKSKFTRAMIGILKVTQNCNPSVWQYVPLQDFTSSSDIDWSESVEGIDRQLYKKYGLDDKEIEFIESHVEAME